MVWMEQIRAAGAGPTLATVVGSYVLGCFATGYLLVRARTGLDIREIESGSIGARNVSRVLGRTGFLLTLAGDFSKGAIAVWAAIRFTENPALTTLAMLAVVAGHIWPAPLHFHGGKGVATSLGALLLFDWRLAVAYTICFAVGLPIVRKTTPCESRLQRLQIRSIRTIDRCTSLPHSQSAGKHFGCRTNRPGTFTHHPGTETQKNLMRRSDSGSL